MAVIGWFYSGGWNDLYSGWLIVVDSHDLQKCKQEGQLGGYFGIPENKVWWLEIRW